MKALIVGAFALILSLFAGCAALDHRASQTVIKLGAVEYVMQAEDPQGAADRVRAFAGEIDTYLDDPAIRVTIAELDMLVRSQIDWAGMPVARRVIVEDLVAIFFEDFMSGLGEGVGYEFELTAEHVATARTTLASIVSAVNLTGY